MVRDAITSPSGTLKDLKAAARKDVDARIEQLKSGGACQPTLREFIGLRSARARADDGSARRRTRAAPVSGVSEWDLAEDVDLIAKLKTKPLRGERRRSARGQVGRAQAGARARARRDRPVPKLRTPRRGHTNQQWPSSSRARATLSADSHQAVAGACGQGDWRAGERTARCVCALGARVVSRAGRKGQG